MSEDTRESGDVDAGTPVPAARTVLPDNWRNARVRQQILETLIHLDYKTWEGGGRFSVDRELGAVVNLNADAVLEPLQALASREGGSE